MRRSDWHTLLTAARAGDRHALDRLLRWTRADARRYATQHCHANDVDDAVQEALLIVARKLSSLRIVAAYSGWLIRVVKRECCRLARKRPDHEPYDDDAPHAQDQAQDRAREDESLREGLVMALQSLPTHYREVLLLRDVEGLSLSEIARRCGLTLANVKSRLHRARTLTREHLVGGRAGRADLDDLG